MIRTKIHIFGLMVLCHSALAQVPLNNTVEHFTNTNCSICASRNPGFYTNVNKQQQTIYISYHPSAPYAACKLSQQNKTDNDARTNHYGIYGSTPRLVINGNVISSSADYSASGLFNAYKNLTSLYSIRVRQMPTTSDSLKAEITIKREAIGTLSGPARLFALLVEDTVWHTGTNGENSHFQVSRKSLFGASGVSVKLPQNPGDSITLKVASSWNSLWNKSRINTVAILQDSASKKTLQSGYSKIFDQTAKTPGIRTDDIELFPNPVSEFFTLSGKLPDKNELIICDSHGKLVWLESNYSGKPVGVSHLASGVYSISLTSASGKICRKLIIQH